MNPRPQPRKNLVRLGCALTASVGFSSVAADAPRRVVLIHGIWDTARTLRKMERIMRDAGLDPIAVSLRPNSGWTSLEILADQVKSAVDERIPRGEKFSIVGFSMGGLVARSYLRKHGDPSRIATIVTISSPHHGTWMAWLGIGAGVREMRPGSAFLAGLREDADRFHQTRWVTVRTPFDLMILPSASSILPWAENHSFPVLLHPLMVLDARVIACTLEALGVVSTKSADAPPASRREESRH